MDIKKLDIKLTEIVEKRNRLSKLEYNDEKYDDLEEELYEFEDDFNETYGSYLENILQEIHNRYCPENDVLMPTSYMAKKYKKTGKNENGLPVYNVSHDEGISVESDKYKGKNTKLVIVPNPTRILLMIDKDKQETVWTCKME